METIDLDKYRTRSGNNISKVFTGRDRGAQVREQSKIDEVFPATDSLEIVIPDEIFSITPSFLEELFNNIVLKYGKEDTLKKVRFTGRYKIKNAFDEAVDRILQPKTGLVV